MLHAHFRAVGQVVARRPKGRINYTMRATFRMRVWARADRPSFCEALRSGAMSYAPGLAWVSISAGVRAKQVESVT